MPLAPLSTVLPQRILPSLRQCAVALVATAFLCAAAQAAPASKRAPAKKQAASATAKPTPSKAVSKSSRAGRNVVATYSKRDGKAVSARVILPMQITDALGEATKLAAN